MWPSTMQGLSELIFTGGWDTVIGQYITTENDVACVSAV